MNHIFIEQIAVLMLVFSVLVIVVIIKGNPTKLFYDAYRKVFLKLLGIIFPIWLSFILVVGSIFSIFIPSLKQNMMVQKKDAIKQLVDSHLFYLESLNNAVTKGNMTLAQAQDTAIEHFRALRYGPEKNDYFWINDMYPFMIMHPYRPDLEGRDLTSFKDLQNNYPFIAMVSKVMQDGGGYVNYYWQWKNDQSRSSAKLSYVKGFKPWGWILGTGIYTEDVKQEADKIFQKLSKTSILILAIILAISFYLTVQTIRIERKGLSSEQELRKSEKLSERWLDTILKANPDPMVVYDLNGYPQYLNPAFTHVFGWTLEDLKGKTIPFVPNDQKEITSKKITEILEHGFPLTFETKRYTKDKVCLDILISAASHKDDGGNAIGMVVNLKDITEQNRNREIIIQSEKMLSLGGLAAGMAHELNNPLAGMIQSASVIRSRLISVDMPANLKAAKELGISMEAIAAFMKKRNIFNMIDAIHQSGIRAAEIVRSMLSFARKSDVEYSTHYPDQLMDEILELAATDYDFKKKYDFKSIEIVKRYDENLPVLICEGAKIQQVLLNILRNGAQAMQAAKTQSPKFVLRVYSKGRPEMLHIEIEDNGPGMDEKTRSKVFDPFFTTKPVGIGTGLGLSVSYFIITESHKGTIEVISEPGKGANFIIRLPIDRKA